MQGSRIRVLQLVNGLGLGGAERIVTMLAMNMDRDRFEVVPCAINNSGPLEKELRVAGLNYRVLGVPRRSILTGPLFLANLMRILEMITNILDELSIDIVHAHLNESIFMGVLAAGRSGKSQVCATIHNVILDNQRGRFSARGWLMRTTINRLFSRASRIIAVSEEVAKAVKSATHTNSEQIVTIPNGIDGARFRLKGDRHQLRRKLGIHPNRPVVVTVGRLTRQKGYSHLLGALMSLSAELRPLTLFVGDGPDRPKLEAMARSKGLSLDVQFLGNRNDIPALLATADLFVLSSLWEGLPLALLEAMAAGLPAVVTSVGGNPEAVDNGVSGLLVPAADEHALATAIVHLMGNQELREDMGRAASDRFDRYFSLQSFVKAHQELYEEMVANKRGYQRSSSSTVRS